MTQTPDPAPRGRPDPRDDKQPGQEPADGKTQPDEIDPIGHSEDETEGADPNREHRDDMWNIVK